MISPDKTNQIFDKITIKKLGSPKPLEIKKNFQYGISLNEISNKLQASEFQKTKE